ncbi:MAG: TonB-dependent receptor, partial [Bacteroidota bacterium]
FLYQTGLQSSIARKQLEGQLQYNFAMPSFLDADWTVGFDYRGSQEDTGNRVYGRNELDDDFSVVGGYAQAKFALADKLDLVLAGRYDRFNFIDDGAFAPRAALVFKASPKHTFRGSFNRANTTVSNLQLNIDFPLSTIIPNSLDVWLYGNKVPQTFSSNPTYSWFTGLIPEVPVGTPGAGLPLGVITGFPVAPGATLNDAVAAGVAQGLAANPATAPFADQIAGLLLNLDQQALGFGGQLSPGFNIFDGSPLPIVDAPVSRINTRDVWEVGYKGLFGDKFGVSLDVYNVDNNNFSQFTAISPAYALVGADGIPGQLGTSVQGQIQPQIEALLLGAGLPAQVAGATAAQLGGLINGAYTAGAADFLNTPSDAFGGASLQQVIDGLPFHATTQTQQSPANGVTHVAAGYRTFDNINYWGADLGTEYYATDDLSLFFNYSWVSETEFMASVVDAEGVADLPFLLNIPDNKYRLGFNYTPEYGFNANASFQHDPSFLTNSGQFSGLTDEKNLIDAGVGYKFDNGLSLEVTAQNLFDSQYRGYPNMPIIGRRVLGRLVYEFGAEGPSDMDGDGIADKKDACPNEPGIKAFNGCADTDGDGIPDKEDNCPMFAGDAINMGCPDTDGDGFIDIKDDCKDVAGDLNGCPDSDGDGVADKDDNCPNAAGTLAGCPDSDGDGVADKDDNCPETAGALAGCPDSDGDGVADKDDKCPNEAGTDDGCPADADGDGVTGDADKCPNEGGIVDENGCPKDSDGDGIADNDDKCPNIGGVVGPDGCAKAVPVKAAEVFTRAIAGINFRSGNAVLTRASYANLDEVVSVMSEFPGLQLSIEGHTDSQGKDDTNMQLSISRAQSVMKYLSDKGVEPTRMRAVGFGELVPIASNDTSEGRLQNRRVEFKASY